MRTRSPSKAVRPVMRRVKVFETEREAVKDARAYDHARAFVGRPPLIVQQDDDGWAVYNPDPPYLTLVERNAQQRRPPRTAVRPPREGVK